MKTSSLSLLTRLVMVSGAVGIIFYASNIQARTNQLVSSTNADDKPKEGSNTGDKREPPNDNKKDK